MRNRVYDNKANEEYYLFMDKELRSRSFKNALATVVMKDAELLQKILSGDDELTEKFVKMGDAAGAYNDFFRANHPELFNEIANKE